MAKYIDAEKLKESLKKRYTDITVPVITAERGLESFFRRSEIRDTIKLIDSLQKEQLEVDLEKESLKYFSKILVKDDETPILCDFKFKVNFATIARHFFELGLNARKEDKKCFQK